MHQNFVFIQYANLQDIMLEAVLRSPLLSQQVIEQAETVSVNKQKQFITCRYLLAKLLNDRFKITSLPDIKIADNNRPKFNKTNLPDFNISHSGDFVAVAVSSQGRIGLDIEFARPRKNALTIAKEFFSEQENSWLNQQTDLMGAFWQLWTQRESALKLYAKGVWQMKEMEIAMPQQSVTAKFGSEFYLRHQKLEKIYLSVCCNQPIHLVSIN